MWVLLQNGYNRSCSLGMGWFGNVQREHPLSVLVFNSLALALLVMVLSVSVGYLSSQV